MRHNKKFNHLGRKTAHRSAMLSNMAVSLIKHKRINTTTAKAKALRMFIEPIITKCKKDETHSRRLAFKHLQDKEAVNILFREIAEKVADRPGGYTRILKTGNRLGDNAAMCFIELVDYNENMLGDTPKASKTARRSRRGGKKASTDTVASNTAEDTAVPAEKKAKKPAAKKEAAPAEKKAKAPAAKKEAAPAEKKAEKPAATKETEAAQGE